MKWLNKGHEFDKQWNALNIDISKPLPIYIFGAGVNGKASQERVSKAFAKLQIPEGIRGFIDNDTKKQGTLVDNLPVVSLADYLALDQGKILISAKKEFREQIEQQLLSSQLQRGTDFFYEEEFLQEYLPLIELYYYNKVKEGLVQISVTERCTLKCKHCAHGCFAVDNRTAKDMTIGQVKRSVDCFFKFVDYVEWFTLLGGEPLLYKDLAEAISYIGENYRKRIGRFYITTNGTLLPNKQLMDTCKTYDVEIAISDYSYTNPNLIDKVASCVEVLSKNQVNYSVSKEEFEWIDFGFPYVQNDNDKVMGIFDACKTTCREVRENRFYYCVMARSSSENLGFNLGEDDYLDLDMLPEEDAKKIFFEFTHGYSDKGYLDMCKHCNSMASNVLVRPGEQLNK